MWTECFTTIKANFMLCIFYHNRKTKSWHPTWHRVALKTAKQVIFASEFRTTLQVFGDRCHIVHSNIPWVLIFVEWMNEEAHSGKLAALSPTSHSIPISLPHLHQRVLVNRVSSDSHVQGTFGSHFAHTPSSRINVPSNRRLCSQRPPKQGSLWSPCYVFTTLWLMRHSFRSFLLKFKPPTPTHPILFPWDMWEEALGDRWGLLHRAEGGGRG